MKPMYYQLALAAVSSAVFGAAAIQAIHAQAKPPVYVIVDVSEINREIYAPGQRSNVSAADYFKEFGGRFLARTNEITPLEGEAPKRFAIIAFDNLERAKSWYTSPRQQEINAIRNSTIKARVFAVEGM